MSANLTRREFAMCVGTCIAALVIGDCKIIEHIAKAESESESESEEDDEEPI